MEIIGKQKINSLFIRLLIKKLWDQTDSLQILFLSLRNETYLQRVFFLI